MLSDFVVAACVGWQRIEEPRLATQYRLHPAKTKQ